jgi:lysophospholipase L1-like esterase
MACLGLGACSQLGFGGGDSPAGPSNPPSPGSSISYTAVGASDANGVGSSTVCLPFSDCPTGKGYVYVATRSLQTQRFTVSLLNLGIPTAVISQRLQTLGRQYGRDILGNFIVDEMPFIQRDSTLVTIFAGANDVNVITTALNAGAGGTNPTIYMDQQVALFGVDFTTLLGGVRSLAPSAHIVVLNLPNIGALPFLATASLSQRQAAQRLSTAITTTVINPLTTQGIRVVDLMCEPRLYQAAQLSADGFHPNDAGYAILADAVVRALTATTFAAPQIACAQMFTVPQ